MRHHLPTPPTHHPSNQPSTPPGLVRVLVGARARHRAKARPSRRDGWTERGGQESDGHGRLCRTRAVCGSLLPGQGKSVVFSCPDAPYPTVVPYILTNFPHLYRPNHPQRTPPSPIPPPVPGSAEVYYYARGLATVRGRPERRRRGDTALSDEAFARLSSGCGCLGVGLRLASILVRQKFKSGFRVLMPEFRLTTQSENKALIFI